MRPAKNSGAPATPLPPASRLIWLDAPDLISASTMSNSPTRRGMRPCWCSAILRRRHAFLRTLRTRWRVRRGDAIDGDASVAGTSLRRGFGWADRSMPVHSWILARVPQHSTLKASSWTTDASALFGVDGSRQCGSYALDRQGPCAQILLRPRRPLLRVARSHEVLLDSCI